MITCHFRDVVDPDKLGDHEPYRIRSFANPECQAAFQYARDTPCSLSDEHSFFRPLMP